LQGRRGRENENPAQFSTYRQAEKAAAEKERGQSAQEQEEEVKIGGPNRRLRREGFSTLPIYPLLGFWGRVIRR